MNLVKLTVSSIFIMLALNAVGCASKSVKTEPTPAPIEAKITKKTVATTKLKPKAIKITQTKLVATPPSQQRTIYFEYNSDELNDDSIKIISSHVDFLLKNPDFQITLEGHADERGSNDYNKKLGSLRAEAIKKILQSKGVNEDQIRLISYGEEKPAVMGNNDNAWQSNRRAIFVYNRTDSTSQAKSNTTNTSDKMFVSGQ